MDTPEKKTDSSEYFRGKFKFDDSWSNDKTVCYYQGKRMKLGWPLVKTAGLIILYLILRSSMINLSITLTLLILLPIIVCFNNFVAWYKGLIAMPAMDQATMLGGSRSICNYMNCTCYGFHCDYKTVMERFQAGFKVMPKFQYKIVEYCGDYYYEKMSEEETLRKAFIVADKQNLKNKDDIDKFCQDNVNTKIPLDGPLWRCYLQSYTGPDGSDQAIIIFKAHHCFADGISVMCMNLFMSAEYDRSFFVKSTDASLIERMYVRLACIVWIPLVLINSLLMRPDKNFITKNKKKRMTGVSNCSSSSELHFLEIKELSKKLGVTINDIVNCAISTTLRQIFVENGETPPKYLNVAIPANIRFHFYPTRNDVLLENKFSAVPIQLPLCDSMENAYKPVSKVGKALKKAFIQTYAQYAFTYLSQLVFPKTICKHALEDITENFTVAYSNTPGAVKPLYYLSPTGEKINSLWTQTYIIPSGFIGFCISAQSWVNSFRVAVTSDDGLIDEKLNKRVCELIEYHIEQEKKRMKDVKVPETNSPKVQKESESETTTTNSSPEKESKKER